MIEYILKKIVDSGMSIAKDKLSQWIKEKNDEILSNKIKDARNHRSLSGSEIRKITLDKREEIKYKIWIDKDEGCESLIKHISLVKDWSSQIGFSDLRGEKSLRNIYIELDTYLTPLCSHFDIIEREQKKPLTNAIFDTNSHVIILGQPGAGKTTSMKKLCSSILDRQESYENSERIPLLIRLRDITHTRSKKNLCFTICHQLSVLNSKLKT